MPENLNKKESKFWTFFKRYSWIFASIFWGALVLFVNLQKNNTHKKEIAMIETAYRVQLDMQSTNMALLIQEKDSIKGELIVQRQLNIDLESAKDLLLIKNTELKNEIAQISTNTITQIDTVLIPYTDTVEIEILPPNMIRVPKSFMLNTEYYSIAGEVRKNGVVAAPSVKNYQTITIGEARPTDGVFSFLKDKIPVVQIENKNPYTETISMDNVIIAKRPPKWYETRVFQIGAGFATGFTIGLLAGK